MVNWTTNLATAMIAKRKAHYCKSGFTSLTKSYHMCAVLKSGSPISYGTNVYINDGSTEHAEAQALRKLYEYMDSSNTYGKTGFVLFRFTPALYYS